MSWIRFKSKSSCAVRNKNTNECGYLCWLIQKPTAGVIAHEAFHIVNALFGEIGIDINGSTDEAVAYMLEYIVNIIYNIK